jgi:hypothetical protein
MPDQPYSSSASVRYMLLEEESRARGSMMEEYRSSPRISVFKDAEGSTVREVHVAFGGAHSDPGSIRLPTKRLLKPNSDRPELVGRSAR